MIGRWGPGCANECTCQNRDNDCDAVTGSCTDDDVDDDDVSSVEQTSPAYLQNSTVDRLPQTSGINTEQTEVVSVPRRTTELQTEGEIIRSIEENIYASGLRNCLPEDEERNLHAFKQFGDGSAGKLEKKLSIKISVTESTFLALLSRH